MATYFSSICRVHAGILQTRNLPTEFVFILAVLHGNWNAKHCHAANMPCHDLIASSFHGAPPSHYAKNGLIYLIGADYVNGIINGRRAKAKRRWKEGGREARSFCNLGGKRASERDKGRLIMSDARRRGRRTRMPSSSPVILIIVTKGA